MTYTETHWLRKIAAIQNAFTQNLQNAKSQINSTNTTNQAPAAKPMPKKPAAPKLSNTTKGQWSKPTYKTYGYRQVNGRQPQITNPDTGEANWNNIGWHTQLYDKNNLQKETDWTQSIPQHHNPTAKQTKFRQGWINDIRTSGLPYEQRLRPGQSVAGAVAADRANITDIANRTMPSLKGQGTITGSHLTGNGQQTLGYAPQSDPSAKYTYGQTADMPQDIKAQDDYMNMPGQRRVGIKDANGNIVNGMIVDRNSMGQYYTQPVATQADAAKYAKQGLVYDPQRNIWHRPGQREDGSIDLSKTTPQARAYIEKQRKANNALTVMDQASLDRISKDSSRANIRNNPNLHVVNAQGQIQTPNKPTQVRPMTSDDLYREAVKFKHMTGEQRFAALKAASPQMQKHMNRWLALQAGANRRRAQRTNQNV